MPAENFTYQGVTIRVETQFPQDLEWLEEFLQPWFDVSPREPDVLVRYCVDAARYARLERGGAAGGDAAAFMMDTRIIEYPRWRAPDGIELLHDEERRLFFRRRERETEIIAPDESAGARIRVMRVIREFAMGAAQAAGGRFLHASAVVVDGRAIVMTGRRLAGKTSLLVYLLSHLRCDFLANDRLLVTEVAGGTQLVGMPTVVSVREGTMARFPGLREDVRRRRFTTRLTLRECERADHSVAQSPRGDKWGLSTAQFCRVMGRKAIRGANPGLVLVPRQSGRPGGIQLRVLDAARGRASLEEGLFGHIRPDSPSEAFTLTAPGKRRVADGEFLDALAASSRVVECVMGEDAYANADGAQDIAGMLRS